MGPWSTDLEPRIGELGSGVTGAGSGIWIDLVRGVGRVFEVAAAWTEGGDGWVEVEQIFCHGQPSC